MLFVLGKILSYNGFYLFKLLTVLLLQCLSVFSCLGSHGIHQFLNFIKLSLEWDGEIFSQLFNSATGNLFVLVGYLFDLLELFEHKSVIVLYLDDHLFSRYLDIIQKAIPGFLKLYCHSVDVVEIGAYASLLLVEHLFVPLKNFWVVLQICVMFFKVAHVLLLKHNEIRFPLFNFLQ